MKVETTLCSSWELFGLGYFDYINSFNLPKTYYILPENLQGMHNPSRTDLILIEAQQKSTNFEEFGLEIWPRPSDMRIGALTT